MDRNKELRPLRTFTTCVLSETSTGNCSINSIHRIDRVILYDIVDKCSKTSAGDRMFHTIHIQHFQWQEFFCHWTSCVKQFALNRSCMWDKIILKLFEYFISHVTTDRVTREIKHCNNVEIILFHTTTSETKIKVFQLLKYYYNYFKIISATLKRVGKYSSAAISF